MVNLFNFFSCPKELPKNIIQKLKIFDYWSKLSAKQNLEKNLKYLLVIDFEATCDKKKIIQEIIEFPCLKINVKTLKEEARFHHFVKPVLNPILTTYCTELTGILQEMVQNEKTFPEVLQLFYEWRKSEGLTENNSLYVTSGDWDLGFMMPKQCKLCKLDIPPDMMEWIDIKKLYANNSTQYHSTLIRIIKALGLEFEGKLHSGLDDCVNLHNVIKKMLEMGIEFHPTSKLKITEWGTRVDMVYKTTPKT